MKERFIENGIEYVRNGDYYIPNLTVPDDKVYNIGKYGRLHSIFIKENRPCLYSAKMLKGTWLAYLEEINHIHHINRISFNNFFFCKRCRGAERVSTLQRHKRSNHFC